jgi:hypothetical protein
MTADAPGPEAKPPASLLGVPIRRPGPARQRRADAAPASAPADAPPPAGAPPPGDDVVAPIDRRSASEPGALELVAADAAPEPARSGDGAVAPAAAPETPGTRPDPAPERHFRDLRHYWRAVARGGIAEVDALDGTLIAGRWPYSLIVRVPDDGLLDIERVFAPTEADGADAGAQAHPLSGDRLSQLSSWVLGLAREAAYARRPQEARDSFQLAGRRRSYKAQLLPCARSGDPAAYVLLGLSEE